METSSLKLFTTALEELFQQMNWEERGLNINGEYLNNLSFADDIVLLTVVFQEMLKELHKKI